MVLPANCRGSYEDWVNTAVEEVEKAALRAEASRLLKKVERPVFVLGESMGAGVALDVAARSSTVAGTILVSPATGWDRTALGGARSKLVRLPDPVLALIIALSSYQVLDRGQLDTTLEDSDGRNVSTARRRGSGGLRVARRRRAVATARLAGIRCRIG